MIAAIVPAKALDRAKGRLAALLSEPDRARLALAMLEDVVRALQDSQRLDVIAVVSPDPEVLQKAAELGAEAVREPESARGINQALSYAADGLVRTPDALLVVLADVPAVTAADIDTVLDAVPPELGVVICPSHDRGTSALALRPPGVIPFRFGTESFSAHKREAAARRVPLHVLRIESLARDVDAPADLDYMASHRVGPATARVLAALRTAGRASG